MSNQIIKALWGRVCSCCLRKPVVADTFICEICVEDGATKRICCNGKFCDHCYTKSKMCPRCKVPTRVEKMTGATYMLPIFSEHEECRICLDPGIKRRCCGNYYCDDCYFALSKCRSCDQPVEKKSFGLRSWGRAYIVTILLGWLVTLIVIILILIIAGVAVLNYLSEPQGILGFTCTGFFPTCDHSVCVQVGENVSNGLLPIQPDTQWKYCDLNTLYKIEASACVFDTELYSISNKALGFDICKSEFNNGVYAFEDSFEHWQNNTAFASNIMKSARWNTITNGIVSSFCGRGTEGGGSALVFFGDYNRFASTTDLDMRNGGRVEADLFMAPLSFDFTHPFCRATFGGIVTLQYSLDSGSSWTDMESYDPAIYRQDNFFHIAVEIPVAAFSSHIRFRFIQFHFQSDRDNWALDNVRILSYLPSGWDNTPAYLSSMRESHHTTQFAQCCFDTDECIERLSEAEAVGCSAVPGYDGRMFSIRQAEIWVLLATALCVIKFMYISVQDYLIKWRFPFQDELEEILLLDFIRSRIPPRFRMRKEIDDFVGDVHRAARLNADYMSNLRDEVGQGEVLVKTQEEVETERLNGIERKRKVLRKKIRRLKRDKQPYTKEEVELEDLNALEEARGDVTVAKKTGTNFMSVSMDDRDLAQASIATDKDDLKRMNLSLLRIPFDTKVSYTWRYTFASIVCGVFSIIFLYKASTTEYYILSATVIPYGAYTTTFQISSLGINFLAFSCDIKEIYHMLRYVVPIFKSWVPLITVDKTDDINALFIGKYTINLDDITERQAFSSAFIYLSAAAYLFAAIPFNLVLLIIREQALEFSVMQYVTPAIGIVIITRVVLGPAFVIKVVICLEYLFDIDFNIREKMGIAMKNSKVRYSALVAAFSMSTLGVFMCSAVAYNYAGIMFGALFAFGLIYGSFAGCIHVLPIRPWFVLTTLEPGIWLHVKKKQRCPCLYWGSFCSDVHVNDEMFIIYPVDDVKFFTTLKGALG